MKRTIWYTTVDAGDGSYYVRFFESEECITLMGEHDPEGYSDGDGCVAWSFTVDGEITGIEVTTLEEVKAEIQESL
jgi:hypothetical protein